MKLLKVPEVAERLSCSASKVYQLLASGALQHYTLGPGRGGKRVSEEQLAAFLASRQKGGPGEPAAPKVLRQPFRHVKL